jgi:hypothetical protein
VQQLLWLETLLKGAGGILLLVTPLTVIKIFGLPRSDSGFWPRLLGAVLLGLSGACIMQARLAGSKGLATGGLVLINLTVTAVLVIMLALGGGAPTSRGRLALGLVAALLLGLSLIEIAYV